MADDASPLISKLRKMSQSNGSNGSPASKREATSKTTTEAEEHCDFCSKSIPPNHRHFADLNNMKFMCACEVCTVMQAEKGEFHPLPQRYEFIDDLEMPETMWAQLKIPVNMAFIVYNSDREQPIAFYPSPAGSMESELRLDSWESLKNDNPALKNLAPDLEGFMINRLDKPHEHFIVPIDCCYELIGLIRMHWQGMHGGDEMRNAVRDYFKHLKKQCG